MTRLRAECAACGNTSYEPGYGCHVCDHNVHDIEAEKQRKTDYVPGSCAPLLVIARKYGVDYGHVLCYSDAHVKALYEWTIWHHRAVDAIMFNEPLVWDIKQQAAEWKRQRGER